MEGKPELTWREEVLELRKMKSQPESQEIQEIATRIGDKLDAAGLDGRDVNSTCDGLKGVSVAGTAVNFLKLIPFLSLLPILILSMGWQIALGRILETKQTRGLMQEPLITCSLECLAQCCGGLFWQLFWQYCQLYSTQISKQISE